MSFQQAFSGCKWEVIQQLFSFFTIIITETVAKLLTSNWPSPETSGSIWISQLCYTNSPEQPENHRGNFWTHGWVFLNRGSSSTGWWVPKRKENSEGEQIHPLHSGEEPVFGEFIKLQDEAVVSLQPSHEFRPVGAFTTRQKSRIQSWALSLQC